MERHPEPFRGGQGRSAAQIGSEGTYLAIVVGIGLLAFGLLGLIGLVVRFFSSIPGVSP